MTTLLPGDKAPEITGNPYTAAQMKGKKTVLYFYPKDNTPGCTAQACNLNENYNELLKNNLLIIGVSGDSTVSHTKFTEKFRLQFPLIADTDKKLMNAYGVFGEKNMYGKKVMGVFRTTFIINENGIIEHIIKKVDTKNHTQQILDLIKN